MVPALFSLVLAGCGPTVPRGGVPKPEAPAKAPVDLEAIDALPGDLDLVVRVDLGKVKDGLGADSARDITDRALEDAGSRGVLKRALAEAEVVWLALRLSDLEAGDRALVVRSAGVLKPEALWKLERALRKNNDAADADKYLRERQQKYPEWKPPAE